MSEAWRDASLEGRVVMSTLALAVNLVRWADESPES